MTINRSSILSDHQIDAQSFTENARHFLTVVFFPRSNPIKSTMAGKEVLSQPLIEQTSNQPQTPPTKRRRKRSFDNDEFSPAPRPLKPLIISPIKTTNAKDNQGSSEK